MVTLEPITTALFPKLYDSFLFDDDPLSNEQDWRNVFDYAWPHAEGHCGYAMLDDGVVVGMMGMVFSQRTLGEETHKFCNLHTWWVREDYRGKSLMLLRPLLALEGYTITHFTPCDKVRAISKRLGFEELSTQLRILLPLSRLGGSAWKALPMEYDPDQILPQLNTVDAAILRDHRPYNVGHLLVSEGSDQCYCLYTHVVRHRLPYCHIHYVSNPALFAEKERAIRSSLLSRHGARFVAMDSRLVTDCKFPRSFDFWAPANGLYKSANLQPQQVDNLYSDVVFLKLTTLPNMSHELGQLAKRFTTRKASAAR